MSNVIRWFLLLAVVVLAFVIVCNLVQERLPIYQLARPVVSTTSPPIQVGSFFGPGVTVSETADRVYFRDGPRIVEVYKSSGGFWFEDSTQLWNPELVPASLPDTSQLLRAAMTFSTHGRRARTMLSADTAFTTFQFEGFRPTLVRTVDRAGTSSTV